jgi:poly-gamma-glutamate synthesis protein (capsule biosynthesis protein)
LIKPYLSGADFTMGNLETTLNGYEAGYSGYPRFNSPDAFAQALKDAGFDFLTTANNHCNDTGEAGILRTIQELDSIGLGHTGTFTSPEARDDISVVDVKGIRLAILAYTYSTNGLPVEDGYGWSVNILDRGVIKADIARAKALQPDLIIVCPHMGVEYAEAPSETYRDWAQYMLQCGADVVIASHPHVLQQAGYETVTDADGTQREGFIIYSMGNFVSSQRTVPRDEGIILNLHIEKTAGQRAVLKDVSFIPTWVEFVNAAGSYDIRVLSVYDALKGLGDNTPGLRQKDVARLQEVESEITNLYLGKSVPLSEIQNEYVMPKPAS